MPKATRSSTWGTSQVPLPEEMVPSIQEELSSSEQETDPEVSFHQDQVRPLQTVPGMFMPYIGGSKMD